MRKTSILFSLALSSLLFFQCSDEKSKDSESSSSSSENASSTGDNANANTAVCIWEKVVLRESPEEKGKYLTSVNIAEKMELLGDEKTDESGSKKREYVKVKLMDGKEGWLIKDFIVAKGKAGAFINDVEIYTRPDLLAKSNKVFKRMDIVGVGEVQGDWCKIKGKRTGGTWIDEGWVKSSDLTYDEKDIAVALYGKQAMNAPMDKQPEELRKLLDNKDFNGSVFMADLKGRFDELTMVQENYDGPIEEEEVMYDEEGNPVEVAEEAGE